MTRRRWIADEVTGNTAALVGEHAAHLARVLRAEIGQEFDIVAGAGVRRGVITSISGDRVEFALGEEHVLKPAPQITLALAIFKFDRMEWAIEKCTEIGVSRIIPVIARRSDAHLAAAAGKRHERWLRLVRQAAEQSRRLAPPEIAAPVKLKDLGERLAGTATRVVLANLSLARKGTIGWERFCNRGQARWHLRWGPKGDGWRKSLNGFTKPDGSQPRLAIRSCAPRRRPSLPRHSLLMQCDEFSIVPTESFSSPRPRAEALG